ncbi:MAG: NAD(P)/FAD-dependent oxidoreductase, partial [Actinomycetota bacterium]
MSASADVVVIGGGLVGCLTARALAKDGLNVRILERGSDLGREASTAAAGLLSPQMEAAEDLLVEVPGPQAGEAMLDFCLAARAGYAAFVSGLEAETGLGVGYRADGTLVVALTPVEAGRLRRSAEAQRARGLEAEVLEGEEIRRLEPAVTDAAALGLHLPDDDQVDPVRLMTAARAAVGSAPGIEIETGTAVRALWSEDGRVAGVEMDRGRVSAAWVVLAAGAWSGGIEGLPRALPVRPVKGQMAAVRPGQPSIRGIVGG